MSKPTKWFVLVPADFNFNQGEGRAINGNISSTTICSNIIGIEKGSAEHDLEQELIKKETHCESPGSDHKGQSTRTSGSTGTVKSYRNNR